MLGQTAGFLGDPEVAAFFLDHAVRGLRAQGRLGPLANAVVGQCWAAWHLGRWDTAEASAAEAVLLGERTGRPMTVAGARLVEAGLAAARGEIATAEAVTAEVEAGFRRVGATTMVALAALVAGFAMLTDDRPLDAFVHLEPYFDDDVLGAAAVISQGSLATFVDAALQCGRIDEARAAVRATSRIAAHGASPTTDVVLTFAETLLAGDDTADERFAQALRSGTTLWPFPRARLLLAHGTWLRRHQRVVESRVPLRGAREIFDGLGAGPWADRARRELRAAGESSADRRPGGPRAADPAGDRDREARGIGPDEPGDRPAAVPVAPHRRLASLSGLSEARHHVAIRARVGARGCVRLTRPAHDDWRSHRDGRGAAQLDEEEASAALLWRRRHDLLDGVASLVEVRPTLVVHRYRDPGTNSRAQLDGVLRSHAVADRSGNRELHLTQMKDGDVDVESLGDLADAVVEHGVARDPEHAVRLTFPFHAKPTTCPTIGRDERWSVPTGCGRDGQRRPVGCLHPRGTPRRRARGRRPRAVTRPAWWSPRRRRTGAGRDRRRRDCRRGCRAR